jgi:hypothetical protein
MLLVLILLILEWGFLLNLLVQNPVVQFSSTILIHTGARVYLTISIAILMTLSVGLLKRYAWVRIGIMLWYMYGALLAGVNFLTFTRHPYQAMWIYRQLLQEPSVTLTPTLVSSVLFINFLLSLVLSALIIWYLSQHRAFFTENKN